LVKIKKLFLTWSTAQLQELLQHLPEWSPLSQLPVYRIWGESDIVDHLAKNIVIKFSEIFLVSPTNIAASCTKAPANMLEY